ncbi:MAG TPA: tetratricopeptide repeat protein [Puia sp.]|nr:tetratricopeptide repeat protein [Puia sp.]
MANFDREHIVRYLEDDLAPEERTAFEGELQRDPALAAETQRCREWRELIQQRIPYDEGRAQLEETLSGMREKYFDPAAGSVKGKVRTLRIYGSIVAAAVLITFFVRYFGEGERAMDKLGQVDMVTSTARGLQTDSLLGPAAAHFNAGQFADAARILDEALNSDSSNQLARFYRGVARWRLGETEGARADLRAVYAGRSLLQYDAAFFLALSYATEKNKAAALEWLQRIPHDAPVAPKARELSKLL